MIHAESEKVVVYLRGSWVVPVSSSRGGNAELLYGILGEDFSRLLILGIAL